MPRYIEVPAAPCPWCGHIGPMSDDGLIRILIGDGSPDPGEGDVVQCQGCGESTMIAPDGLRKATDAEVNAAAVKATVRQR